MQSVVTTLIDKIGAAAQGGDYQELRRLWQELYDTLRNGHPIDDTEAFRLVAALDEAGTFDHLAGDAGADLRKAIDDVVKAVKDGNDDGIAGGVATIKAHLDRSAAPLRRDDADRLMTALRDARAFDAVVEIGERLIGRGQDHATLRRIFAQGLIDRGQVAAGIDVLSKLANSKGAPDEEQREALGLLGRAHKQMYVTAAGSRAPSRVDSLKQAIDFYRRSARNRSTADTGWLTINMIALAKRGQRDGIVLPGQEEADRMAGRIITELGPKAGQSKNASDLATMGEAYIAVGDVRKASEWYGRYANHADVTAFHLGGSIRQLEEMWGIRADGSEAGQMLLALKTRLLSKRGGEVTLTREESIGVLTQGQLSASPVAQSILGPEGPVRFEWLALGMQRPPAIARICRSNGMAEGTGFLVDPNHLSSRLAALFPNELLLLTNIHVVSKGPHPSAMTPDEARIYFDHDTDPGEKAYRCVSVWENPQHELDAQLLSLDPPIRPQEVRACPLAEDRVFDQLKASALRTADDRAPASNVYIMGHPLGQRLCFSLHDTEVLDKGAPQGGKHEYLHYRTPTQKGHSGSPVFDDSDWRVVALHHAGAEGNAMIRRLSDPSKRHKANEGISIKAIRREVEAAFKNRRR